MIAPSGTMSRQIDSINTIPNCTLRLQPTHQVAMHHRLSVQRSQAPAGTMHRNRNVRSANTAGVLMQCAA
jgi:hypothetical protein